MIIYIIPETRDIALVEICKSGCDGRAKITSNKIINPNGDDKYSREVLLFELYKLKNYQYT